MFNVYYKIVQLILYNVQWVFKICSEDIFVCFKKIMYVKKSSFYNEKSSLYVKKMFNVYYKMFSVYFLNFFKISSILNRSLRKPITRFL